ncbi:MAG: vitamin K epoxide reductase family protein [bacterium]|nr:hypothetical protein [Candidatus Sumerlaeota bacterium]
MSHKHSKWDKLPLYVVECAGLSIAIYLLLISLKILYPESVPCPRGSIFACHSILRGQYAHIGPFSIAGMGVMYFAGQLVLTVLLRRKGWLKPAKFVCVLGGLAFVAYLRALELLYLHKICPWCYGVALTTLLEMYFAWPLAFPWLPRIGYGARAAAVIFAFIFLIGGGLAAGNIFNPYTLGAPEPESAGAPESKTPAAAERKSQKTAAMAGPSRTPKPSIEKMPVAARTPQRPAPVTPAADATPLPQPNPAAAVAGTPAPGAARRLTAADLGIIESSADTAEMRILRARGWIILANTDSLNKAARSNPPVLLLVFDPLCEECHALIHGTLSQTDLDDQPVTRLVIDSSNLEGPLSAQVKNVPTIIVLDKSLQVRFNHEGLMEMRDLLSNLRSAIGQQ